MGGRSRSNSVEEITLRVPSLDPRFAIFIDLCSCDFQASGRKLHSAATGEFILFLLVCS